MKNRHIAKWGLNPAWCGEGYSEVIHSTAFRKNSSRDTTGKQTRVIEPRNPKSREREAINLFTICETLAVSCTGT